MIDLRLGAWRYQMSEYGCKHIAEIGKDCDHVPAVVLWNDLDNFYVQYFTKPEELDKLIARLQELRRELWGDR